ncbi:MAG TPA: hypothetical protein VLD59_19335, partial [Steroidobacteraceae bacterium]|nr:hypothetical protein [Steroidobacteraceae bacterium]
GAREAIPEDASTFERAAQAGLSSAAVALPAIALAGPAGGAALLGAGTGGSRYSELRAAGKSPREAARSAVLLGSLEALTEFLPAGKLVPKVGMWKPKLVEFLVREVPGENVMTLAQMVDDLAQGLREDITGDELLAAIKETTAATAVGGGAQVGAARLLQAVQERANRRAPSPSKPEEPPEDESAGDLAFGSLLQPTAMPPAEPVVQTPTAVPPVEAPAVTPEPELPEPGGFGMWKERIEEAFRQAPQGLTEKDLMSMLGVRDEQYEAFINDFEKLIADPNRFTGGFVQGKGIIYRPLAEGEQPEFHDVVSSMTHNVDETGEHIFEIPGVGKLVAQEDTERRRLQARRIDVEAEKRGQGYGFSLLSQAVRTAHEAGLNWSSDTMVSPEAARLYEKLEERGYDVERYPADINPETGDLVSRDPRIPVFEVRTRAAAQPKGPLPPISERWISVADDPDGSDLMLRDPETGRVRARLFERGNKYTVKIPRGPTNQFDNVFEAQQWAEEQAIAEDEAVPDIKPSRKPNAKRDSLVEFISKTKGHGATSYGISREEAIAQGIDPHKISEVFGAGIKRLFTKGGMSFDHAAEILAEAGYPVLDEQGKYSPNVLLERLTDEIAGRRHFSVDNETEGQRMLEERRQREREQRAEAEEGYIQGLPNAVQQRAQLLVELDEAEQRNDAEEAQRIRAELAAIEDDFGVAAAEQPDMFGTKSQTAQEIHDREEERKRKMREAPGILKGPGELFAGPRPAQADVEDEGPGTERMAKTAGGTYQPMFQSMGAPAASQGSITVAPGTAQERTVAIPKEPVRREHIMDEFQRLFGVKVFQGKPFKMPRTTLGFFRRHTGEVRVRAHNDLEVT